LGRQFLLLFGSRDLEGILLIFRSRDWEVSFCCLRVGLERQFLLFGGRDLGGSFGCWELEIGKAVFVIVWE
jgi:hypothetical protein